MSISRAKELSAFDCLLHEDGANRLYWNVANKIPVNGL